MKQISLFLALALIVSNSSIHAMQPKSNIILFQTLMNEAIPLIPKQAMIIDSHIINDINTLLSISLAQHACGFANKLYENPALRPYITPVKDDLKKQIESCSQNIDLQNIANFFGATSIQMFSYLVLHRALNTYPNVILYYTISGSCEFFDAVVKQCAQDYAPRIRVIVIDANQFPIMGLPVDRVPTLIFFRKGKEVYRRVGFDVDAVNQKFTETDTPEYKVAAFRFLQEQIGLSIQKHLLS